MHPAVRILLYLCSALALPGLNFFALAGGAAVLAIAGLARRGAMFRLAWRARWLFLLMAVGYAYGLPGEAALPRLGGLSPSVAGLEAGGLQMLRLLLLLWLLDLLVLAMGSERMMSGLHSLFSGLRGLGFPAERTTVRLGLTLEAMESNALKFSELAGMLAGLDRTREGPAGFSLRHEPWRARDGAALTAGLILLAWSWLV